MGYSCGHKVCVVAFKKNQREMKSCRGNVQVVAVLSEGKLLPGVGDV